MLSGWHSRTRRRRKGNVSGQVHSGTFWQRVKSWFSPIKVRQVPRVAPAPPKAPKQVKRGFMEGELGDAIARAAERELGTREVPRDSNRGIRVQQYQEATWLEGSGWPWCAAFVCWCVREAIGDCKVSFTRPMTAGAWDFERWAKKQGLDLLLRPGATQIQRGDILVYTFSHIGIATGGCVAGEVDTVEGNTTPGRSTPAEEREGGGVYRRERDLSLIRSRIRLID